MEEPVAAVKRRRLTPWMLGVGAAVTTVMLEEECAA